MTPRKPPPPDPGPGPDDHQILTPAQVARLFHVGTGTVAAWARTGKLPSFRTAGGHRRFYAADIRKHLPGPTG